MPKQINQRPSRVSAGATREKGEKLSEYFEPAKGQRYIRRHELLAILTQFHKASRQNHFMSKLWRWLKSPRGSGGVHAVGPPKKARAE